MTAAFDKNRAALAQILGSGGLADRLLNTRIGIWSDAFSEKAAGRLLAEALGDCLGRLWQQIDAEGPLAGIVLGSAEKAAVSAGYSSNIAKQWNPPYEFVISIGTSFPAGAAAGIRIGADGWSVRAGAEASVTDNLNPVGPTLGAALASAEVFKHVFEDALNANPCERIGNLDWSAWTHGNSQDDPDIRHLDIGTIPVFGVGAVTHGLLWIIERWPYPVSGTLDLVDPDRFDDSNAQRYAGLQSAELGHEKASIAASRLSQRHLALTAKPHVTPMNDYFEAHSRSGEGLVIAGLDSPEARRQLALKVPRRAVNMWTQDRWLGSARFGFEDGWPCLYCAYPEDRSAPLDEAGELSAQTGLLPRRVRELLFSGKPLEPAEVQIIAQRYGIPAERLHGKPLRSIRGQLCATGKLALPKEKGDADVPLPFSSLMAGVFGFVELVKEITKEPGTPTRWAFDSLYPPRPGFLEPAGPRADCYLCSDGECRRLVQEFTGTN